MAFDAITSILNIGSTLIERLIPDKSAQEAAKSALLQMQVQGELAQIQGQLEVDKTEAGSQSIFVAGWRPFIGWICGCGLGYQFLVRPLFQFVADLLGSHAQLQSLDLGTLMTLLFGMLGLGAMRTVDKINGAQSGH